MLREAIELQQLKAAEIVALLETQQKEIVFRAPTGSGKTRIIANVMNQILAKRNDIIFIVSAPSAGGIAQQDFDSFDRLTKENIYSNLSPVLISSEITSEQGITIPRGYNVYVLPSALLGKGRRISTGGALDDFLVETTRINHQKVFVIRDECHTDTSNLNAYINDFSKIVHVSATPQVTQYSPNKKGELDENGNIKLKSDKVDLPPDIEISDIDAINAKMIKDPEYIKVYDKKANNIGSVQSDLFNAFDKLAMMRTQYDNNSIGMRPCLIIQIDNKGKGLEELNNFIKPALKIYQQNTGIDFQWAYIASIDNKDKKDVGQLTNDKGLIKCPYDTWKDLVKNNTSPVDIIIFKMAIKEGYDIPRACMLYQIRNTGSSTLDEQVLGRIRRNPHIADFELLDPKAQKVCLTGYVWGVKPENKNTVEVKRAFPEQDFLITPTRLKINQTNKTYNTRKWLDSQKVNMLSGLNIFDAYRTITSPSFSTELYNEYKNNIKNVEDWYKFLENFNSLKAEIDTNFTTYSSSMYVENPVPFPECVTYSKKEFEEWFSNWMWKTTDKSRCSGNKELYSFDSAAEKEWARIINLAVQNGNVKKDSNNNVFLIGKNYPCSHSQIYFEYYDGTVKKSFPDFFVKSVQGSVHIFESKSINHSNKIHLDGESYRKKIAALIPAYQQASYLTGYHFYIPILQGNNNWTIWWCYKDNLKQITPTDVLQIIATM